ncbi:MAG TPA: DUF4229 domain-containing protein [Mycobacteriales bacterium]|nr:DUF4229 domain-containing protein [Mycobacteriales bacterium]
MTAPAAPRRGVWFRYNVARLGLLVAALGLGYVAGLRGVLLAVAALLVSGVLSYFVLSRLRIELAAALSQAVDTRRSKFAARAAREDAVVDALADRSDGPAGRPIS